MWTKSAFLDLRIVAPLPHCNILVEQFQLRWAIHNIVKYGKANPDQADTVLDNPSFTNTQFSGNPLYNQFEPEIDMERNISNNGTLESPTASDIFIYPNPATIKVVIYTGSSKLKRVELVTSTG